MKFSTLLFTASAAFLPASFAIEEPVKKYLRSAISAISPFERSLAHTDWCPGFNDQLCIKTNQPADGGLVEFHADFTVSPNADGTSYDWKISLSDINDSTVSDDFFSKLDTAADPIMLKYAIIPEDEIFDPDNFYIKYGGSCHNTEHESCVIIKHQHPDSTTDGTTSWDSVDGLWSGTIPAGSTLIWWLHINIEYAGDINTSFALPCETATGDTVDGKLKPVKDITPDYLSYPFDGWTFVDPDDDGSYNFDHIAQNGHGWGWQFYYTAPTAPCDNPDDNPDCDGDNCDPPPVCIPDPEVDITDTYCTTVIKILAGQHIPVGTATLTMQHNEGVGFEYTVTATIDSTYDGPVNGVEKSCHIRPKVPDQDKCENVKVSGKLDKPSISKHAIGKYEDKCCLPQEEVSVDNEILIAEGSVLYGEYFPLAIKFDLQVYCDVVDGEFSWTDASCETAFSMLSEWQYYGDCPLADISIEDAKHGWGEALIIDTLDPSS